MTESHNSADESTLVPLENVPMNSKEAIFKKQLVLGSVMFGVIVICTMIATVK